MSHSTVGMKVLSGLAAGVTGFMVVGSYKAHVGNWQNEADVIDREKSMDARLYREELAYTGNSFVPSIIHSLNRPDMLFLHKFRRIGTYTKGFVRDVIWNNALPLALGTMAVVWGFNINVTKVLSKAAKGMKTVAKLVGLGLKTVWTAAKALCPKVSPAKIVSFMKPTSPKAVLTAAAAGALGLVMLPYMFFDAARGDKSERMGEDFLHRFH